MLKLITVVGICVTCPPLLAADAPTADTDSLVRTITWEKEFRPIYSEAASYPRATTLSEGRARLAVAAKAVSEVDGKWCHHLGYQRRLPAMRLAWMTDLHLNFLEAPDRRQFLDTARDQADAFVISGDIAESPSIIDVLTEMEQVWQKPIHFVLGNHDFYRGSIVQTRCGVANLAHDQACLTYLTATGVVKLASQTALIGHDGWADARLGDFDKSDVFLNDYVAIQELRKGRGEFALDKSALRKTLNVLGDEAARHFEVVLQQAVAQYPYVITVTHVPPFKEAAWYDGRHSDDNYLPHFACKATGDAMRRIMEANPQSRLLVLCGHTHGRGETQVLENLQVLTGGAEYGHPAIEWIFDIG